MSNAAKLRKKAAEFEQQKQYDKAILHYRKALEEIEKSGEEQDVTIYNRVGDLLIRQGAVNEAVTYLERAVELYTASALYNNAIALCNKILRHTPGRSATYLTLGRICARKGLRGDATRNLIEYATRMQQAGRIAEALTGLVEFVDLVPEQTELRTLLEAHIAKSGARPVPADPAVPTPPSTGPELRAAAVSGLTLLDTSGSRLTPPVGLAGITGAARQLAAAPSVPPPAVVAPPVAASPQPEPDLVFLAVDQDVATVPGLAPRATPEPDRPDVASLVVQPLVEDPESLVLDTPVAALPDLQVFSPSPASAVDLPPQLEGLEATAAGDALDRVTELLGGGLTGLEPTRLNDLSGHAGSTLADAVEALDGLEGNRIETPVGGVDAPPPASSPAAPAAVEERPLSSEAASTPHLPAEGRAPDVSSTPARAASVVSAVSPPPSLDGLLILDDGRWATPPEARDAVPLESVPGAPGGDPTPIGEDLPDRGAWVPRAPDDAPVVVADPGLAPEGATVPGDDAPLDVPPVPVWEAPAEIPREDAGPPALLITPLALDTEAWIDPPTDAPAETAVTAPDRADASPPVEPVDEEGAGGAELTLIFTPLSVPVIPAGGPDVGEPAADLAAWLPEVQPFATDAVTPGVEQAPASPMPGLLPAAAVWPTAEASDSPADAAVAETEGWDVALAVEWDVGAAALLPAGDSGVDLVESVPGEAWGGEPPDASAAFDSRDTWAANPHDLALPGELPPLDLPGAPLDGLDLIVPVDGADVDLGFDFSWEVLDEGEATAAATAGLDAIESVPTIGDGVPAAPAAADAWADLAIEPIEAVEVEPSPAPVAETGPAADLTPSGGVAPGGEGIAGLAEGADDLLDELFAPSPADAATDRGLAADRIAVARAPYDWQARRRLTDALFGAGDLDGAVAVLLETAALFEERGRLAEAAQAVDEVLRVRPNAVEVHQRRVELAVRTNDPARLKESYLDLADALQRLGEGGKSQAVFLRVLELDPWDARARAALGPAAPPAPPRPATGGYVELGAWLQEEDTASTRLVMAAPEPTGDEEADFQYLLQRFKAGVAEAVGEDDHDSHYDLGVAYKEMGLLDDAIAEFQKALRGRQHRLRSYEALGQCFVEQRNFQVAVTVLSRALAESGLEEQQLVGVCYLLGYASEGLQRWAEARRYYERVYATDVTFRDVAARLTALDRSSR